MHKRISGIIEEDESTQNNSKGEITTLWTKTFWDSQLKWKVGLHFYIKSIIDEYSSSSK